MAEVVVVPGTGQSLPKVHLKASDDLKAFEREVAALVCLRTVSKQPKPSDRVALAIAEGSPKKPEAGQSLATSSEKPEKPEEPEADQLAIADDSDEEPLVKGSKRTAETELDEQGRPLEKKMKVGDGQSGERPDEDGLSPVGGWENEDAADGPVVLGDDNGFSFLLAN